MSSDAAPAVVAEKASAPLRTPIASPLPTSIPPPPPPLTQEEQAKYDQLLVRARSWSAVFASAAATAESDVSGPLTDADRAWLSRECLLRYLRATGWVVDDAEKRLLSTLTWRRTSGVVGYGEGDAKKAATITTAHVAPENETGKQLLLGYDMQGRPCHYLIPGRQNTGPSPRQAQHVIYMLERVIELMPPGQETIALLLDFKPSKTRSNTMPSLGLAKEILHILQNHYPERLGRALCANLPWFGQVFFKIVMPFVDPRTRHKIKYDDAFSLHVPREQLLVELGGTLVFDYDHATYWPALAALCEERRALSMKRWEEGGRLIGESEVYMAGGTDKGVGAVSEPGEHTEPAKLVEPAGPAGPSEPAGSAGCAGSTEPVESAKPVDPVDPAKPAEQTA